MSTEQDDERFATLLTAFDEALGRDDLATIGGAPASTDTADDESRLRRAQRCLLLLEVTRRLGEQHGLLAAASASLGKPISVVESDAVVPTEETEPEQMTIGRFAIVRELGRG